MGKSMRVKIIETIKNLILAVLFVAMVILAGWYITQTQRFTISKPVNIPLDSLLVLKDGDINSIAALEPNTVIPQFIGYKLASDSVKTEGKVLTQRGIMGNKDIIIDMYNSVGDYIKVLLGANSTVSQADVEWKSLFENEDYIYLKYHSEIPAPVIYMFLTDETSMDYTKYGSLEIPYIHEILIVLNYDIGSGLYRYNAYARGTNGKVYCYEIQPKYAESGFNTDIITVYNSNSEFIDYSYSFDNPNRYSYIDFYDTVIFTDNNITTKMVSYENIIAEIKATRMPDILKLFDYNPDRVNTYSENSGNMVYIENFGNLKISSDGHIVFSASPVMGVLDTTQNIQNNVGIPVSEYLGYGNYSGKYSICELVKSTGAFISMIKDIDKRLLGGDADIGLSSIYKTRGETVIEYSYYFDNIKISDNTGSPYLTARFIIADSNIINIEINSLNAVNNITRQLNYSQSYTLKNIDSALVPSENPPETVENNSTPPQKIIGDALLSYRLTDSFQNNTAVSSEWMFVYNREDTDELE